MCDGGGCSCHHYSYRSNVVIKKKWKKKDRLLFVVHLILFSKKRQNRDAFFFLLIVFRPCYLLRVPFWTKSNETYFFSLLGPNYLFFFNSIALMEKDKGERKKNMSAAGIVASLCHFVKREENYSLEVNIPDCKGCIRDKKCAQWLHGTTQTKKGSVSYQAVPLFDPEGVVVLGQAAAMVDFVICGGFAAAVVALMTKLPSATTVDDLDPLLDIMWSCARGKPLLDMALGPIAQCGQRFGSVTCQALLISRYLCLSLHPSSAESRFLSSAILSNRAVQRSRTLRLDGSFVQSVLGGDALGTSTIGDVCIELLGNVYEVEWTLDSYVKVHEAVMQLKQGPTLNILLPILVEFHGNPLPHSMVTLGKYKKAVAEKLHTCFSFDLSRLVEALRFPFVLTTLRGAVNTFADQRRSDSKLLLQAVVHLFANFQDDTECSLMPYQMGRILALSSESIVLDFGSQLIDAAKRGAVDDRGAFTKLMSEKLNHDNQVTLAAKLSTRLRGDKMCVTTADHCATWITRLIRTAPTPKQCDVDRQLGLQLIHLHKDFEVRTASAVGCLLKIWEREKSYWVNQDGRLLELFRSHLTFSWRPELEHIFVAEFHQSMKLACLALVHGRNLPVEVVLYEIVEYIAVELLSATMIEKINKCEIA